MRTFFALDLPEDVRRNISLLIENLQNSNVRGINWVAPENLHITFQFIGDTQLHDIPEIGDLLEKEFLALDKISFSNPKLEIIPPREPRIIWISLQTEHKNIFKAARQFKNKLLEMGYEPDKKSLRFHITLGRIKKRLPDFFIQKILTTELKIMGFKVSEATLYESFLRPQGPVYEKVLNYKF
ncbi:MAG: RNA 2',3'-cyclic phosphodiesterase [Candidatus Cloacimonadales bacterium]|nr:RNA 2',3'-cyclic phosphodiesterase [Candidatus Cloacimonadales bacterium]